jgi:hypothetical protein
MKHNGTFSLKTKKADFIFSGTTGRQVGKDESNQRRITYFLNTLWFEDVDWIKLA